MCDNSIHVYGDHTCSFVRVNHGWGVLLKNQVAHKDFVPNFFIYWNRYTYLVLGLPGGRDCWTDSYHSISPEWIVYNIQKTETTEGVRLVFSGESPGGT